MSQELTVVRVRLDIPASVYDRFEDADNPEEAIVAHLEETCEHSGPDGVFVDSPTRIKLQKIIGNRIQNQFDLLAGVTKLATMSVAGVKITVSNEVLQRLKSRAIGTPLRGYLESLIKKVLEIEVGLG